MKDTLVVVTGPTAVGKTELCLDIAGHYGIPIINADSRQIYKGLRIGTAAPTKDQLQKVKHYFVGTLKLEDYYNASMYEQEVMSLLAEFFAGDGRHIALMTGGSMMYIDSVCNGIDDIPAVNAETRELLKERLEREGLEKLCSELKVLDPEYYSIVDRKNTRRVIHGLEICYQTGKPYTYFRKKEKRQRPFNIVKIALNRPREELYGRINNRVDEMLHDGLLEEARTLYPYRELNALNTVGYKEIFEYFDGSFSMEEAVERIKGNTRRYARKQLTWFKRDEKVRWFDPNDKNEIMNYISQEYEKEF